jgi:glycosyltransferase involved in cell wall biosynthesis
MSRPPLRILAVGMLPPPIGGQSVMFECAIDALRADACVDVIDIQAQRNLGESGILTFGKLRVLAGILSRRILPLLVRRSYDVLYYCPAGPNRLGLLKDILFLAVLRRRARRTVYHFHATGSGAFIERQPAALRWAARRVLFRPDLAVRCAAVEPNDARAYHARAERVIWNGIRDPAPPAVARPERSGAPVVLTFIGALVEDKGIFDLLEIVAEVRRKGYDVCVNVVGEGTRSDVERFDAMSAQLGLVDVVHRRGVLTGPSKLDVLAATSIFVFPSFFRAETQSLAVIEAHAMGIPAVAYDWRGIGTIIEDGATGYVVPVRSTGEFAERLARMIDQGTIPQMGARARRRFEERFTIGAFATSLKDAIANVVSAGDLEEAS